MGSIQEVSSQNSESVVVAVHIRPLIRQELEEGAGECVGVTPGAPQVSIGPHSFAYDHVYGGDCGKEADVLYDECVAPLVEGLFKGYNATVFAYGQTGSGKTYTMGSAFPHSCPEEEQGVIPKSMRAIFQRVQELRHEREIHVRVGFVEIHKEEIKDLLSSGASRRDHSVHIREIPSGGIILSGASEVTVQNEADMVAVLERGTCLRATGATGMNQRSSRSHAIFTITIEQRSRKGEQHQKMSNVTMSGREVSESGSNLDSETDEIDDSMLDDSYLCAKMHLVDLAGSERAKRTKNEGLRLQEGININKGLLALGNVINALCEGKSHVPYRDSKLTRMLTDSLGGNSRTIMIACVSPADINLEESLNTLRYAHRARAIKNTPVVNRDPVAALITTLRQQLRDVKAENAELRKKLGITSTDHIQKEETAEDLSLDLESARSQIARLTMELSAAKKMSEELKRDLQSQSEESFIAAMQRDKMAQALTQHLGEEKANTVISNIGDSDHSTVETALLEKVRYLEEENRQLRANTVSPHQASTSQYSPMHHHVTGTYFSFDDDVGTGNDIEEGDGISSSEKHPDREIERVALEMEDLQRQLEAKEAAIKKVTNHASMQVAYKQHLQEIQAERDSLAKERSALMAKIKDLEVSSVEERTKLENYYKTKLRELDQKVKLVKQREMKIKSLEVTQQRASQKVKELEGEIRDIKAQRAALQRQTDKAGKDFLQWKKKQDREVMHLKKEKQAANYRLMKMEAQHVRQQAYLKRKIEEAAAARKRLQDMKQGAVSSKIGAGNTQIIRTSDGIKDDSLTAVVPDAKSNTSSPAAIPVYVKTSLEDDEFPPDSDRKEWIEKELDACCSSIDLQKVLEGEKASRSEIARQLREIERKLAALKNPHWWGKSTSSPNSNNSEEALKQKKKALLAQAATHGKNIQEIQLSLLQVRTREEERGEGAADPGRWSSVHSINAAHATMTSIFQIASKYKSQAYEAQLALTELGEEVEMLKLKLEVAEAERLETVMRLEDMTRGGTPMRSPLHRSVTKNITPVKEPEPVDREVEAVLHELDRITLNSNPTHTQDQSADDDNEVDSSISYDVQCGETPAEEAEVVQSSQMLLPGEQAALDHINRQRRVQKQPTCEFLSSSVLIEALCGTQMASGRAWNPDKKTKADLIVDYLTLIVNRSTPAKPSPSPSRSPGLKWLFRNSKGTASPNNSSESFTSPSKTEKTRSLDFVKGCTVADPEESSINPKGVKKQVLAKTTGSTGSTGSGSSRNPVKKKAWIPN